MKYFVALLLVCVAIQATFAVEERLISLNENHREWMSLDQIEHLYAKRIKFIDLTWTEKINTTVPVTLAPIPTVPAFTKYVGGLTPSLSQANLKSYVTSLSAFFTRYYTSQTGVQAAEWIYSQFQTFANQQPGYSVRYFKHTWAQPSVIARIDGQGPNRKEIVIIGAHEDSVGASSTGRSPGADDDGSGVATIMETFRVLVQAGYKPDRTIEFMTYAGEEAGLLGSQAVANAYRSEGVVVHAAFQFDMTGYVSVANTIKIITDYTDSSFNAFLRTLVTTYTSLTWVNSQCGYACSDHASWNRAGYRSCFPHENSSNKFIHSANDIVDNLNFPYMLECTKLALVGTIELAGVVA